MTSEPFANIEVSELGNLSHRGTKSFVLNRRQAGVHDWRRQVIRSSSPITSFQEAHPFLWKLGGKHMFLIDQIFTPILKRKCSTSPSFPLTI